MPPLPRVLCRGYRSVTGKVMPCYKPVMQEGEAGGRLVHDAQCPLCGALNARATEATLVKQAKRTERRAATGKLTTVLPVDPFKGFHDPFEKF